jgi:S-adenosylmethionine/arginine decarboxylase-like enzyme
VSGGTAAGRAARAGRTIGVVSTERGRPARGDAGAQVTERCLDMDRNVRERTEPMEGQAVREAAIEQQVWGIASSIDIYNCDADLIRDADAIRRFVAELCELIDMKRFGETLVVHFGEDEKVAGYSMAQLIETSLISAHFANLTNTTYLDVFSCRPYDPDAVRDFAESYFRGTHSIVHVNLRR